MRRFVRSIPVFLAGALMLVPAVMFAQESRFGPIIPQIGACTCPGSAPNYGCVLQTLQSVINVGIALAIVLIVLAIAYAGFILITAGANPGARSKARQLVQNSVVGLAIVLCAWLGVDFVMKAIYDPTTTFQGQNLGPWNAIWASTGDDMCLEVREPLAITSGDLTITEIQEALQGGALIGGVGACSPSTVRNAAQQGGVTMTQSDAAVIACFAGPESSCGANMRNYCWDSGRTQRCPLGGSTAWGPFQILLSSHSEKFETPACYRAAGVSSGRLNCASGFSGGRPIQTAAGLATVARCQRAAANLSCSAVVAKQILDTQGPSAWSGNHDSSSAHQACTVRNR